MLRKNISENGAIKLLQGMIGDDDELRSMIAEERTNLRLAEMIYEMRTQANLTQRQLADRVGTKQSVIARLENADYKGHSLTMLDRIAISLGYRLVVDFAPNAYVTEQKSSVLAVNTLQ